MIRFNEIGGLPPCIMTLPTRRPELLQSRYPMQVEASQLVIVDWSAGHALDLPGRRWDYVLHGAATADPIQFMRDPDRSLRDTISTAASIANIARASTAKRLVLISSGAVYGDQPGDLPEIPETFRGAPDISALTSGYGEAKRVSELLFRLSGVDQRVARVFSVIGPYQDLASHFAVPDLIRQAAEHGFLQLTSDGSGRRSFCYASDLTICLVKLLVGEVRHDVYNVGCREGTASVAEVANMLADIFGGLEVRPTSKSPEQANYVPQLDRLYETYAPRVGLREALLRTCHSLFARGLIDRQPVVQLELPAPGS